MENHPIPQDVTGFKFRLIGSITLKQFLYLLGAGAIALVLYFLPIPLLVKIPFMMLAGGIGMAFAFVPIDGRPMDKMIYNFARTLPSENQYLYHKQGVNMIFFSFTPPPHAQLTQNQIINQKASQKAQMFNQLTSTYFKPDQEEVESMKKVSALFQDGPVSAQGFTNRVIQADAAPLPKIEIKPSAPVTPPKSAPEEIKTVSESLVKPHMPTVSAIPQNAPTPAPLQAPQPQPVTQPLTPQQPTTAFGNSVLSSQPSSLNTSNVLMGTVVDPRGKPLPHVIIEVIDVNNIPVRTFRTNQSGGFAAATPLPNGTYKIHLEDSLKKQNFSDVEITFKGAYVAPITITSVDQREQLRRELFGNA